MGSGTFVRFRGMPCLLTASHVWERCASSTGLAFVTDEDIEPYVIPTQGTEKLFATRRESDDWGPDIALIRLPEVTAKRLEVRKAFYDLDRDRDGTYNPTRDRAWVAIGGTAEGSDFCVAEAARLRIRQVPSRSPKRILHDGVEYIELPAGQLGDPEVPALWKGMSGAGLWMVDLTANQGVLAGVAYYAKWSETDVPGYLRCHTRSTIDEYLAKIG